MAKAKDKPVKFPGPLEVMSWAQARAFIKAHPELHGYDNAIDRDYERRARRQLARRHDDMPWDERGRDRSVRGVQDALYEAGVCVASYPHQAEVLPIEAADDIARLFALLDERERAIPQVECWRVLKVYGGIIAITARDAIWSGHLSEQHAEAFRATYERYYELDRYGIDKPRKGGDSWVVSYGPADITDVCTLEYTPFDWLSTHDGPRR